MNVVGTLNVLEAARPHGAQLVFSSTGGAIYGECERPAREEDARRPALAVRHVEARGRGVPRDLEPPARDDATSRSASRTSTGRGSWPKLEGGVVAIFLDRLRAGEGMTIFGDGEQTRDYVYVGDVVARGARRGRAATAASSTSAPATETSVNELFDGLPARRRRRGRGRRTRPHEPGTCCGASSTSPAAERELGWRPQTPLEEGLRADLGLRPAATFIAIRVAFWLGAAATLIWAPAPDRRLIGDAYGPASDFLFQTLSQWDARWFLQISLHGYEEVPQAAAFFPVYPAAAHALAWVTGSTLVAGVLISLAAGAVAAWVLAQLARPLLGRARRARRRPLPRALPRRLRLHVALLGRPLPRPRRRLVPGRDAGQAVLAGVLGGSRPGRG